MKKHIIISILSLLLLITAAFSLFSCGSSEFKITFIVGGQEYYSIVVSEKDNWEMPDDPTIEGSIFDGWFVDSERWTIPFNTDYFKDKNYIADIYVYSKWITPHVHTAGEFEVQKESTCTEDGLQIKKCTECDEILLSEPIAKKNHTEVIVEGKLATETVDGYTEGSYCSVCNDIIKTQTLIPADIQGTEIASDFFERSGLLLSASVSNPMNEINLTEKLKTYYKATVLISYDKDCQNVITGATELSEGNNEFYVTVSYGEDEIQYTVSIYRRSVYTVSFDTRCDEMISAQVVEEGCFVEEPEQITNGNAIFKGWYYNGELWNFEEKKPDSSITLIAKWDIKVTFDVDGVESCVYVELGSVVDTPERPEKDRNVFRAWLIKGTNESWDFNTPVTEEITLVADWIPSTPGFEL